MKRFSLVLPFFLLAMPVHAEPGNTIRICDDTGCAERPRSYSTFDATAGANTEEEQRMARLIAIAEKEPRAAYDLGLRFFRGQGVRQDSYQALKWMRDAAERGYLKAQTAVGRFYLSGLEEMGSDPAEAEKWLSLAAGRGDREARKLLSEASKAKRDEATYRKWADSQKAKSNNEWMNAYQYEMVWRRNDWYYGNYRY